MIMDTDSVSPPVSNFTSVSQRPKNNSTNYIFSLLPIMHIPSESSSSKCLRFLKQIEDNKDKTSSLHKVKDTTKKLDQGMTRFFKETDVNTKKSKNNLCDIDGDDSDSESLYDENIREKHLNKLYSHCVTSTPKSNKSQSSFPIGQVKKLYVEYNRFKSPNGSIIPSSSLEDLSQKSRSSIEDKKRFFYNKLESSLKSEESEREQVGLINKLVAVIDKYEKDKAEKRDSGAVTASTDLSHISKTGALKSSNSTKEKAGKRDSSTRTACTDLSNTSKMAALKPSNLTRRNKKRRGKKKSELDTLSSRFKKKRRTNEVSRRGGEENRKTKVSNKQQNKISKDNVGEGKTNRRCSIRLQNRVQTVRLSRYDYFIQQCSNMAKAYERPSKANKEVSSSKRKQLSTSCGPNNITATSKKRRLYCSDTWLSSLEKMASL